MIKVLIVEDSSFMRRLLKEIFEGDKRIQVVGEASNGKEALDFLKRNTVDVITLDIEMPVMDGIEFLKEAKLKDTAVLMLSSLTKDGAKITLDALELGAVDFVEKPENFFSINTKEKSDEIISKIVAADSVKYKVSSKKYIRPSFAKTQITKVDKQVAAKNLIVIGSSTGGPRALQEIIPKLSADIDAGIVVVQHMPKGFTKSLADRLDRISELKVKEASDLDDIYNGHCYIAKGDYHMEIVRGHGNRMRIKLNQDPLDGRLRPSVDKMLYTLEKIPNDILIVILTGMGKDGTKGIKKLKSKRNLKVYSEDESTCVVYGMPKSVEESGLSDKVVKLSEISKEIENYLEGK